MERIHPEIEEPVKNKTTNLDLLMNQRFFNPYSTREEYNMHLNRFLKLQSRLLLPIYEYLNSNQTIIDLNDMMSFFAGRNESFKFPKKTLDSIVGATKGILWDFLPKDFVSKIVLSEVLPDWKKYVETSTILRTKKDLFGHSMWCEEFDFEADKILFMYHREDNVYKKTLLKKDSFTNEEMADMTKKAKKIYDVLLFSECLYGINFFGPNPIEHYLEPLISIIGRIGPGRIKELPKIIKEGEVEGWFDTNDYDFKILFAEIPWTEEELIEFRKEQPKYKDKKVGDTISSCFDGYTISYRVGFTRVELNNISEKYHKDIKKGDKIYCILDEGVVLGKLMSIGL